MERCSAYITEVIRYKNMVQKTCNRMSRDRKKGSSPQLVVCSNQSVLRRVYVCVLACFVGEWGP